MDRILIEKDKSKNDEAHWIGLNLKSKMKIKIP